MKRILAVILLCLSISVSAQDEPLKVVATTTIIADVAQNVGGNLVEVIALIPPNADSHTFIPSPRDVAEITEADVILVNGAFLEESLLEIVEDNAEVEIVVVSNGVFILSGEAHGHDDHEGEEDHDEHEGEEAHDDEHEGEEDHDHSVEYIGQLGIDADCGEEGHDHEDEEDHDEHEDEEAHDDHEHGACDPHVWMNPENVMMWTMNIADALAAVDSDNAETYQANAESYIAELEMLVDELEALVTAVPEENRILVTNHDFLAYFAASFDFEVVGTVIPGVSTVADVNPRILEDLIEIVGIEGVPAIFAEVSSDSDLAQTVADEVGFDVEIVTLFSGSLSDADGEASTYLDYMRYNVGQIVAALSE